MGNARDAVMDAVRDHGPISFAEYMELALYGPSGYYEDPPVGPEGDFVTSPHVHPVFGTLLAAGIRQLRDALGHPDPFRLVEVGAGDGTLARQLTSELLDVDLTYTAVERSAGARAALARIEGVRVAGDLDGEADLVLAHELLDNLPFRRIRRTDAGPVEVLVGLDRGRLVEMEMAFDGEAVAIAPGSETVIPEGADAFVDRVARMLRRGYALIVDYGADGSSGGDPHGYRGHRAIDVDIDAPGTADITVGVDFARVSRRAEALGLTAFPTVTQSDALRALGFESWIADELRRQHALLEARDVGAVRVWSDRSRATLLADPAALGRLRWLVLATPDLPAPGWLDV
jgi:SAM-dependent MidA family methyltransferase